MISSRQADAGLGIETAIKQLKLHFSPITSEYYFLIFRQLNRSVEQVLTAVNEQEGVSILDYNGFAKFMDKE